MTQSPIIKTVWDGDRVEPADVGELARGISRRFDGQPTRKLVEFNALYTEPMFIALDKNPMGILCIRVRQANAPESSVLSGGMVDWVWSSTRAKVTSIDGMSATIGNNIIYTFTFEAVFAPQVGA